MTLICDTLGKARRTGYYADIRTLMDRTLWARFGEAALQARHAIQWLSDNRPPYTTTATVLYAHELGLVPITTPAYSPQSNGLAEAFLKTLKRDDVEDAGRAIPRRCWRSSPSGFEDFNTRTQHSAFGMRSQATYRVDATLSSSP